MSSEVAMEMYGSRWKRYPAYRDSGVEWIGEVPEGWDVLRLKKVAHFGYGNSLAAEDRVPGDYCVYGSNGIVGKHEQPNTKEPCLIIGRKGSFGKVAYSDKSCFAIDTTYFVDSTLTNNNLRWLFYCLQWLQLDSFSKDSAVPGLAREDAYQNLVPFCSFNEQRAIAAFLDRETGYIDTLIEKKERQVELLQEKRAALVSHAITKGLNPNVKMKDSGVEWIGEVPEEWEVKRLRFLFQFLDNYRIPVAGEDRAAMAKMYPYYGASGIIDYVDDYIFDESLILVAEDGANLLSRSTPLAFIATGKYWVNNHAHILRPINGQLLFWEGVLQTYDYSPLITGAAQPKLTKENLGSILLPYPPIDEQRAIAAFLNREKGRIDIFTTKVHESISKLREYRTALISAAVTGKIDVREDLVS